MFGVPFQYTLSRWSLCSFLAYTISEIYLPISWLLLFIFVSVTITRNIFVFLLSFRILLARLEYLRETFQIKEGDFLTFDALVWYNWCLYLAVLVEISVNTNWSQICCWCCCCSSLLLGISTKLSPNNIKGGPKLSQFHFGQGLVGRKQSKLQYCL